MTPIKPQILKVINYFFRTLDQLINFSNFILVVKHISLTALTEVAHLSAVLNSQVIHTC
jgi:hypothetical protein